MDSSTVRSAGASIHRRLSIRLRSSGTVPIITTLAHTIVRRFRWERSVRAGLQFRMRQLVFVGEWAVLVAARAFAAVTANPAACACPTGMEEADRPAKTLHFEVSDVGQAILPADSLSSESAA